MNKKTAWLVNIFRGFGGDNATYETRDGEREEVVVSVSWGLTAPNGTAVMVNGNLIGEFREKRRIQPAEALSLLGYEVHGTVDFSACVEPSERTLELLNNE